MPSITELSSVYYNLFVNDIFGGLLIADIFFMGVMVYWGLQHNWSFDGFAVVLIPCIIFLTFTGLPPFFRVLTAIIGGMLLAYELYRLST